MAAGACVAALLLAPLLGVASGQAWFPLDHDSSTVSLLQTKVGVKDRAGRRSRRRQPWKLPKECGGTPLGMPDFTRGGNNERLHSHRADFSRPIPEVMREHPGVDGYCYFNNAAMYIQYRPEPRDYVREAKESTDYLGGMAQCDPNAETVTYHWEGESISTRPVCEHYLYDDLYGYFLGVLQGQGIDSALLSNATAWKEVSAKKCQELQREYNITDEDLVLNDLLDNNMPILIESECAAGVQPGSATSWGGQSLLERAGFRSPTDCRAVTKREFALHHYMKCTLGYANSGSDIAYLHARACLLEGNRIGHGSECPLDITAAQ